MVSFIEQFMCRRQIDPIGIEIDTYIGVLETAEYESILSISKLSMADPLWLTESWWIIWVR